MLHKFPKKETHVTISARNKISFLEICVTTRDRPYHKRADIQSRDDDFLWRYKTNFVCDKSEFCVLLWSLKLLYKEIIVGTILRHYYNSGRWVGLEHGYTMYKPSSNLMISDVICNYENYVKLCENFAKIMCKIMWNYVHIYIKNNILWNYVISNVNDYEQV
jgi:hypothetical protein